MRVIVHRGGRGFGPDNTIEAMEEAVRFGVKEIETDVRATADGRLVICHDAMIWGRVVARTDLARLREVAPDRPLLTELLDRLAGKVTFNLEVKKAPLDLFADILIQYDLLETTLVTSFDTEFVARYKERFPKARIGFLFRRPGKFGRRFEEASGFGAEVVLPYFNGVSEGLVKAAHYLDLPVLPWTVNGSRDIDRLVGFGVDGFITDDYRGAVAHLGLEEKQPE